MIKNFSIFKNNDHDGSENKPTHYLSAKIGEEFQRIGVAWTKEGKGGTKYLSCSLDKPYQDKPGYTIEVELPAKNNAVREPHEGAEDESNSPF